MVFKATVICAPVGCVVVELKLKLLHTPGTFDLGRDSLTGPAVGAPQLSPVTANQT